MASRTTLRRHNLPVMHKRLRFAFPIRIIGLPLQVIHIFHRTNEILGVAMAVQTKFHRERRCVINLFHLVHLTMTVNTADPAVHMLCVVKLNVVWSVVNLKPLHRLTCLITLTDGCQLFGITFDNTVAIHTSIRRRNRRML